jgi:parafibromin
MGVYVGWRGETLPDSVKGWGRGVLSLPLDPWTGAGGSARWRDREIVEAIWKGIEDNMRQKGWTKESGPSVA